MSYAKKIKKAILYGKTNFNDAKCCATNMMSKVKVPFYSYKSGDKSTVIHYQLKIKMFGNLYLANKTRYIDSDVKLGSSSFFLINFP